MRKNKLLQLEAYKKQMQYLRAAFSAPSYRTRSTPVRVISRSIAVTWKKVFNIDCAEHMPCPTSAPRWPLDGHWHTSGKQV